MRLTFGAFTLDARTRQLLSGNRPVHLSPKAFDLLAMLAEERPAAVSKDSIHQRLWPGSFVSDGSVAVLITELRAALCDDARNPAILRTLHRFGYAFVAASAETAAPVPVSPTQCWLMCEGERAALIAGDNVVGRDPGVHVRIGLDAAADLRLEATGVSRRHAVVVVTEEEAFLHDLSSKNGTFVGDVRVTAPVPITDGADIRVGSVSLHFRRLAESPTDTHDVALR